MGYKETIISRLKDHIQKSDTFAKAEKKNPEFARALKELTTSDISYTSNPHYRIGYLEGNSTGVGETTSTKRTLSLDWTSATHTIGLSDDVPVKLQRYAATEFDYGNYIHHSNCGAEADDVGDRLLREDFSDINMSCEETRLNRWHYVWTSDEFTLPFWGIIANIVYKGKQKAIVLGYYWEKDGKVWTCMDYDVPMTTKKKWIIAGCIIGGVVLTILAFIIAGIIVANA